MTARVPPTRPARGAKGEIEPEAETEAGAGAERRRALGRLRALANRLEHQASLIRNGGFNPQAEAEAGGLADNAFAVRCALRRIAPESEAVGQVFQALQSLGARR